VWLQRFPFESAGRDIDSQISAMVSVHRYPPASALRINSCAPSGSRSSRSSRNLSPFNDKRQWGESRRSSVNRLPTAGQSHMTCRSTSRGVLPSAAKLGLPARRRRTPNSSTWTTGMSAYFTRDECNILYGIKPGECSPASFHIRPGSYQCRMSCRECGGNCWACICS